MGTKHTKKKSIDDAPLVYSNSEASAWVAGYNLAIEETAAQELLDACMWSIKQFKKLADEGRYPDFMLAKNGGDGIMPLINAIKKATE